MELPLRDLVVVEIGHSIAAPYAGAVLAGLGAEVIKVERTGVGDPVRDWGPPYSDGAATAFQTYNRGKAGIAVDFSDPSQRDALAEMIAARADVVIQNLKAGAADRAGLGAAALRARKPSLVYCNLHAFGAAGPLKKRPGYDPLMQAYGGLMSVTGEAEGRPPVRVGVSLVDMGAGMWAVIGILSALRERDRSGRGATVDVSLYETAIGWMQWPIASFLASGQVPRRLGSGTGTIVPYQVFATRDSEIMIAAGNDGLFAKLSVAIEAPQLAVDARFRTNGQRVQNRGALVSILQEILASQTTRQWLDRLGEAGVPVAPIQDTAAVVSDPQTEALGILQRGAGSEAPSVGLPVSFDGMRPPALAAAPALGADNERLLPGTDRRRSTRHLPGFDAVAG